MSEQSVLPTASDTDRLLQRKPPAPSFDETRHTDDGPEISYNLLYGITVRLGGRCTEEAGLRIYSAFGRCVERWLEQLAKRRDQYPPERRPRLPTGHLDLLTAEQKSDPGKVVAIKKMHSIKYSGDFDVIGFELESLKSIVFQDLCDLYEMLVCDLGSAVAAITVGDDAWRATMAGNVPEFSKATFGITTVPGTNAS